MDNDASTENTRHKAETPPSGVSLKNVDSDNTNRNSNIHWLSMLLFKRNARIAFSPKLWLHVQFLHAVILDSGWDFSCQSIFSNTFDLSAILAACCNSCMQ